MLEEKRRMIRVRGGGGGFADDRGRERKVVGVVIFGGDALCQMRGIDGEKVEETDVDDIIFARRRDFSLKYVYETQREHDD